MNALGAIRPPPRPLTSLPLQCIQRFASTFPSLPPELQPIIGLEIHVQLKTHRKLFSCNIHPCPPVPPANCPSSPKRSCAVLSLYSPLAVLMNSRAGKN